VLNLCTTYLFSQIQIKRILSPEFNLNAESKCCTDEITQKIRLKLARFEDRAVRAGKFSQNLENLLFYYRLSQLISIFFQFLL
jgi:hypothetical protein